MVNFQYYNPSKIVFGAGAEKEIHRLLQEEKVTSLLMVYSGDFIKELGIFDVVRETCRDLGIAFYENGTVVPNPSIQLVRELAVQGKEQKVDFVLAVVGGSWARKRQIVQSFLMENGNWAMRMTESFLNLPL